MANRPGEKNPQGQIYTCSQNVVKDGVPDNPYTSQLQNFNYGSDSNNYNITDPNQINDPNFAVSLAYKGTGTVLIESVKVSVFYNSKSGFNYGPEPKNGNSFAGICVSNEGRRVAVGRSGLIVYSDDGQNWTDVSLSEPTDLFSVAWAVSKFTAVGSYGAIFESTDSITWAKINVPEAKNNLYSVRYDRQQNALLSVGNADLQMFRLSGRNWEYRYN